MKKLVLTSLAGILAISTANAFEVAPYASIKGGYSVANIAVKGDSLNADALGVGFASSAIDAIDIRLHTNGVWSINPAFGAKMSFEDFRLATFRVEAEYAHNQEAKKDLAIINEDFGYVANAGVKTWGLMANAYMDFETGCFFKPFVMAGIGFGQAKLNVSFGESFDDGVTIGESLPETKDNNLIWAVGGGFTFDIDENVAIDLQYRYMDNGSVTAKYPYFDGGSSIDIIDVKDVMHQFMLGARYAF